MKLRSRLAISTALGAFVLLAMIGWAQSEWRRRIHSTVLADAIVDRMDAGGREACEAAPDRWPPKSIGRSRPPHRPMFGPGRRGDDARDRRLFAYDTNFRSRNPKSPPFPRALSVALDNQEIATLREGHGRRRKTWIAIRLPGDGPCAIVLARMHEPPWLTWATLFPAFVVAIGAIVMTMFTAGPIVARIRRLTASAESIGQDVATTIAVEGKDEIADLARAFEKSRCTIEAQLEALRQREKALRDYMSTTTHDVMVPLTVLQGHLSSTLGRIERGEMLDTAALMPAIEESQYIGALLHNMNAMARLDANQTLQHHEPIDLNRLVERVTQRHRPIATRKDLKLDFAVPEEAVTLKGDETLMEQALNNLVHNAVRYHKGQGHVAIALEKRGASWSLRVIDDGPGMTPQDLRQATNRAFRGDDARTRHPHGMGLGLHIVADVAKRHDLLLELRETPGGGLTAELQPAHRTRPGDDPRT